MSGESIDYTIVNKNKIVCQQGKIDNIIQKQSDGFIIEHTVKFQFEIKLKSKSIVNLIQLKPLVGDLVLVQLMQENNSFIDSKKQQLRLMEPHLINFKESSQRKKLTQKIKIQLTNKRNPNDGVGLIYLLVRGQKIEDKQRILTKENQDKYFTDPKYSAHKQPIAMRMKETQLFNNRKKNRDTITNKKIDKQIKQMGEDYQMEQALQISKRQLKNDERKQHQQNNSISFIRPRQYTKVNFEKYQKIFEHVNSTWLQAQRRVQIEKQIKQHQRLSNAVHVKHFYNKDFCIQVSDKVEKQYLEKICIQMGGNLKQNLCDYCLLITNKLDTQKVQKAKKMKGVKVLKPAFIRQCKKCEAYLDEKNYFQKL